MEDPPALPILTACPLSSRLFNDTGPATNTIDVAMAKRLGLSGEPSHAVQAQASQQAFALESSKALRVIELH